MSGATLRNGNACHVGSAECDDGRGVLERVHRARATARRSAAASARRCRRERRRRCRAPRRCHRRRRRSRWRRTARRPRRPTPSARSPSTAAPRASAARWSARRAGRGRARAAAASSRRSPGRRRHWASPASTTKPLPKATSPSHLPSRTAERRTGRASTDEGDARLGLAGERGPGEERRAERGDQAEAEHHEVEHDARRRGGLPAGEGAGARARQRAARSPRRSGQQDDGEDDERRAGRGGGRPRARSGAATVTTMRTALMRRPRRRRASAPSRRMPSSRSSRLIRPGSTAWTRTPRATQVGDEVGHRPVVVAVGQARRCTSRPPRSTVPVAVQPRLGPGATPSRRSRSSRWPSSSARVPDGGDPPPVEDDDAVADPLDLADEVGVEQHRDPAGLAARARCRGRRRGRGGRARSSARRGRRARAGPPARRPARAAAACPWRSRRPGRRRGRQPHEREAPRRCSARGDGDAGEPDVEA